MTADHRTGRHRVVAPSRDNVERSIMRTEGDEFLAGQIGSDVPQLREAVSVYSLEWARERVLQEFHEVGLTPRAIAQALFDALKANKSEASIDKKGNPIPEDPHWNIRLRAIEIAAKFIDLKEPESDKPDKFEGHVHLHGLTQEKMRFIAVYGRFPTEREEKELLAPVAKPRRPHEIPPP